MKIARNGRRASWRRGRRRGCEKPPACKRLGAEQAPVAFRHCAAGSVSKPLRGFVPTSRARRSRRTFAGAPALGSASLPAEGGFFEFSCVVRRARQALELSPGASAPGWS